MDEEMATLTPFEAQIAQSIAQQDALLRQILASNTRFKAEARVLTV